MVPELDYTKASEEQLRTWNRVTRLFVVSTVSLVILLAIMAATLL
jgi:hypothetical protein